MDADKGSNKSMHFGGGYFDSLQLCSYKEIQSNDSAENFHNYQLEEQLRLRAIASAGEDEKGEIALSQPSTPHPLQTPADSLWPSSAYR